MRGARQSRKVYESPVLPSFSSFAELVHQEEVVRRRKIKDKNVLKYYTQFMEKQTNALARSPEAMIQKNPLTLISLPVV